MAKTSGRGLVALVGLALAGASLAPAPAGASEPPQLLDARIVRFEVARTMKPGRKYKIEVIVENKSSGAWREAKKWILVCRNTSSPSGAPARRDEFGFEADALAGKDALEAEERATIHGEVEAPEWNGRWTLSCWMTYEGKKFGDVGDAKVFVTGDLDASITKLDVASKLDPGRESRVYVTTKNTGKRQWEGKGDDFVMVLEATKGPKDAEDVLKTFRLELPLRGKDVGPGESHTFSDSLPVPTWSGEYELTCTMTFKGDPFGDPETAKVTVDRDLDAQVTSIKVNGKSDEVEIAGGRSFPVEVRVRNKGHSAWNEYKTLVLRVTVEKHVSGPEDDPHEFEVEIPLASRHFTEPGKELDLKFKLTTPRVGGTWKLAFQMFDKERRKGFGRIDEIVITVTG